LATTVTIVQTTNKNTNVEWKMASLLNKR